jgi:hypothetical protein
LTPWLAGGRTDMSNLILLCERHHVAHHDGAFTISTLPTGQHRFDYPRHDLPVPTMASQPGTQPAIERPVAPDAATPRTTGQRLDRHYAISVLAERRYRPTG